MAPCLAFSISGMIHDIKSSTTGVRQRSRRVPPVANEVLILPKHLTIDFVSGTEMPTVRSLLQSDLFHLSIHSMLSELRPKKVATQPRPYTVQAGEKEYRRNRRHLLAVPEPIPAPQQPPEATSQDASPFSSVGVSQFRTSPHTRHPSRLWFPSSLPL